MKAIFRLMPLMLALAACKTTPSVAPGTPGSPAESESIAVIEATPVEKRAVERWELLIAGKPEAAYDFLTPGYRQTRSKEDYTQLIRNRPIQWTGVNYVDKFCDSEDACSVKVIVQFKLDSPVPGVGTVASENPQQEQWIRAEGQWYFLPNSAQVQKGLR